MDDGERGGVQLRVADSERDPVLELLKEAYAEGRLEHDEFEMRMHLAMTAKTRGDLAAVTADLNAPQPQTSPRQAPERLPDEEARLWAAAAHGTGLAPVIIPPLVIMLLAGRRSEYVRRQAAEAVNFQLTLFLVTLVTFGLGGILYTVAWIPAVIGAVFALGGRDFCYPWILRLVK
ncbi:DUF1707 and DUF4870 domain-containing protein [Thermomonospora catenispora]|uniref:DUF1707 and DUF4870 domain-containing protein n=1 Tax=Thermomonospora catenispora TaxID=2493090 RepID=UPI0011210A7E|nr:DUF1707 and DUF4870 domain-containing protein [Thermomonospora catenispora]TNY35248.1 DUF1707 and DUF4870 domain-containing protein [Thermomonospora catenispora]